MAWGTAVQKLRTALRGRAGQIFAERHPCASDEFPLDGEELSSEQLESVTEDEKSVFMEVFQELGNMDQPPPSRGRCRWRQLWRSAARRMLASAQEARRKSASLSVLLSWRTARRSRYASSSRARRSSRRTCRGRARELSRGRKGSISARGCPWESYQVRAPRGSHVV
ncbi:unnamed protein product [Ectocarpus sp. 6 AP-2014]